MLSVTRTPPRSHSPSAKVMPTNRVLDIRDNGIGFDPAESFPGHLGLNSMRERVMRLGGVFTLESMPDQGTHLRASIPLLSPDAP